MAADGEERRLRERALRLLTVRDRTRAELEARFHRQGADGEIVQRVLNWLEELGYLDDERFAVNWIRARRGRYGPRRLEAELREKGLDPNRVREHVERHTGDEERLTQEALDMIRRRLSRSGSPGDQKAYRRLMAFLLRRGYPVRVAARALQAMGDVEGDPSDLH